MSVEKTIRTYILQNFLFTDDESALTSGDSLIGKGIVDSTGALEIVHFLEERFGIKVHDSEMVPDNLDSVNKMTAFIARKQTKN